MTNVAPRLGDRSLFPALTPRAYLNHAAVSPLSLPVLRAMQGVLDHYARSGLGGAVEERLALEDVRGKLARLIGAEAREIGFVQSTTAGVIAIARSIAFRPGERIVLFEGEFPANVTPFQRVAEDLGLHIAFVPLAPFQRSPEEGLLALDAELARGARLVAVSAVEFQTGLRMPLAEIAQRCHAHGAELFVDAIQALGAVPLDVKALDIDYLTAGSHKFLLGPDGAGFVYVRHELMAALRPSLAGWTSHEDAFRFLGAGPGHLRYDRGFVARASFFEQGALSVASYAGLGAAVDMILALGVERIHAHVNDYLDRLEPSLLALGATSLRAREDAGRSASLCVRLPEGHELADVARRMGDEGVAVSTPDGHLRFAPHYANALDEVPVVVDAFAKALGR